LKKNFADKFNIKFFIFFTLVCLISFFVIFKSDQIRHYFSSYYLKTQKYVSDSFQKALSLKEEYLDHFQTVDKLRRYKKESEQLSQKLNEQSFIRSQNSELKKMVKFASSLKTLVLTTRIISTSIDNFIGKIILPVGKNDGIYVGMSVVSKLGIVGRIESVGENFSDVLLITDPNSRIVGFNPNTSEKMIVAGLGNNKLQGHFVEQDNKMMVGDIIYTTGEGGYFPEGLPIGKISEIHNSTIHLDPMFEMREIFYVQVIGNQTSLKG